jgi:hypothetical protein
VVRLGSNFSAPALDYISRLDDLEHFLSGIFGCKVDVFEEPVRKERFKERLIGIAPLPSERPARRLEDIIDNVQAIQRYIAGME